MLDETKMQTPSLQSKEHADLLDAIDALRSQGISHYVQLPQLIVCGDQSSGKSSVLEAVAGIAFPRKDNLCTRFATEVVLRRDTVENVSVAIVPGADRSEEEKVKLASFKMPTINMENFPSIVDAAADAMGVTSESRSFSQDILRVEKSGPEQPHLTLVDLPGVVHAETGQQSSDIPSMVTTLVQSYMDNTRSVILAVVSAKNDYANQIVTTYARKADPQGGRTLGIITKPDELHPGSDSEREFLKLAANEGFHFRLGWHVLRNRGFNNKDCSTEQRDHLENDFFSNGVWRSLPVSSLGISSLRPRLSGVLKDQIIAELPSLLTEVDTGIQQCNQTLVKLGDARGTLQEQKLYLIRISQNFTSLVRSAVDGVYSASFFDDGPSDHGTDARLRAKVQDSLLRFASDMRCKGYAKHIVDSNQKILPLRVPPRVKRSTFMQSVKDLMRNSRGRELPGTFNPLIIGDLFFQQAKPWKGLVDRYSDDILKAVQNCLELVMSHATDSATSNALRREVIDPAMASYADKLRTKTAEILRPHESGHAVTYNHYFSDTVQKARRAHLSKARVSQINQFFGRQPADSSLINQDFYAGNLSASINQPNEVDLEDFGCSEAIDCMMAYYKVAMKVFVDNFASLCIEQCLLNVLSDTFSPESVIKLDDAAITRIAAETDASNAERKRTMTRLKTLESGLDTLNRLHRHSQQVSASTSEEPKAPQVDSSPFDFLKFGEAPRLDDEELPVIQTEGDSGDVETDRNTRFPTSSPSKKKKRGKSRV
ncbi:MAG: hypothetical protein M1828_002792 [Chrysothrix sp. TS-e1954]|nr:MAG: hypothetical protein M1828_002792 [Chrysothrix sp. TS-e1954]